MEKKNSLPPSSTARPNPKPSRMLKTTVILAPQQQLFLDHLSITLRHNCGLNVKRTALIRILIAALADSHLDMLPYARSQKALYEALRDQLRRGRA